MSPHYITRILPNMSSGQVSIRHKFTGPNLCNSTACAAGVQAIGDGYNMIRLNHADVMVCGSTEATINPMTMSGFSKMRALTTKFNDDPVRASRPFDRLRDGFVLGEGCGIVVLERLEHAQRRNAEIVGEILGYGLSSDGSHITQPSGQGAVQSMKQALNMAQLKPEDIGYINAHATSTPIGDRIERQAISEIFHELNPDVYVSSTKGSTGHLLGGAGSVETIFTILACLNKRCPPTLNYNQADDENDKLNISSKISDSWTSERRIALKNSFGFGGTNSTIIVGNYL
ncbi:unnamed protein product [Didymodactylos carnosus]|nr:unnamed protein product [Didymodactylos carnosus]CAF3742936.1 unnamed protein product [Didymodactylos carnosus]